jgi:hypothetical protein
MNAHKRNLLTRMLQSRYPNAAVQRRVGTSKFDGVGVARQVPVALDVIDQGTRSLHNSERPLHRNIAKVKIENKDAANVANVIIFAGLHAGKSAFSAKVLGTGDVTTTNDAAQSVVVNTSVDYGIDSTVSNVENLQQLAQEHGIIVSNTRLRYTKDKDEQLNHKLRFQQWAWDGDHVIDFIDPSVDFDPKQFHKELIDIPVKFVVNKNTILHYTVEPEVTVTLEFLFMASLDLDRILVEHARNAGGNVLM